MPPEGSNLARDLRWSTLPTGWCGSGGSNIGCSGTLYTEARRSSLRNATSTASVTSAPGAFLRAR